jgi:very-short-patch-repair endonuclease
VTSPLRTLLDLAATLDPADLERTVNEAQVLRLVGAHDLAVAGRHGAPKLRAAARIEPRITRSRLERAMLALVRRAGLPVPETSVLIHDQLVDFYWPDHRLVVETDGYDVHATRARFEADRARDARLVAAGYVVLRFTWRQLEEEPEVVAARLAAALALSASAA